MSEIDSILNFIDGQNQQPAQQQAPASQSVKEPQVPTTQTQPVQNSPPTIFGTQSFTLKDDVTDAEYKKHLSTLNRLKKKASYPCLFNQQVINSAAEMEEKRKSLMGQMKVIRQKRKDTTINSTKLQVDKLPEVNDESELVQDGAAFYKKRNVTAIKDKEGKLRQVPTTSPMDRKKIYEYVKNDKELLKQLIQEENPELFRQKTSERLSDELRPVYQSHADNDINRDETWTRESLLNFFKSEMKKQQSRGQRIKRVQTQEQQQVKNTSQPSDELLQFSGVRVNPALFH